jgi:hypothetical protein
MTESFATVTAEPDSTAAGVELGRAIRAGLNGQAPHAIVVFASAQHDYRKLLRGLAEHAGTDVIVGSSSAGEFSHETRGEGHVSALALRSGLMSFSVGLGRNLSSDPAAAARSVVSSFRGMSGRPMPYRAALVMTDALAGHSDAVVEHLTMETGGNYSFVGGGAGDDGLFHKTYVFAGTEIASDAVVALEMQSMRPIGIGVSHGWDAGSAGFRVTEADGMRLVSLNGAPAVHAFESYAEATGQSLNRQDPLPFFLHNILGIVSREGFRLRVPLGVNEDGSISCAAAVPTGAVVHIMKTSEESAVRAAERATQAALAVLDNERPSAALVFDCVATRLRLGRAFGHELDACAALLRPARFVGCNTYGQIARAEGQFGGFHNCTAVVCAFPQ